MVVGPRLRRLLLAVLALFALLAVNSAYLGAVSLLQWLQGSALEDQLYQFMFLGHLALGIAIIAPVLVYGLLHLRRAWPHPNRLAVRLGLALLGTAIVLLATGLLLTRGMPLIEVRHPLGRSLAYWLHVLTPVLVAWLFVMHRLAGRPIRWAAGAGIAAFGVAAGVAGAWLSGSDNPPADKAVSFHPALARTADGHYIPAEALMRDDYCAGCHADAHAGWQHSAHRFASFNNPAYRFSVLNTRAVLLERDGNVHAARFCAGCHDPAPLFSGRFDDPDFDHEGDPSASAGITCIACHAIESVAEPLRGNADYTIAAPKHYPFAFSRQPLLAWLNGVLIKANPDFHKRTFLKPMHRSPEFCGTCHKVHIPEELNDYRWLRGQNHYDSFLLSGVSGHGVTSFNYPDQAQANCNGCHMPLAESADFAARDNDGSGRLTVHGHGFPAANTALAALLDLPGEVIEAHRQMLEGALRVDLFAIREGEGIDAPAVAPLRPQVPVLRPGATYVLDAVLRTLTLGHHFTQGTADSNEVWLEVVARSGDRRLGHSGALDGRGAVDPWSHFVNSHVLDRDGARIDRRNVEDIFTPLYNHQIPPGSADVVHYRLTLPPDITEPVVITARLHYRKFDTTYLAAFQGDEFVRNDLPVVTIASDEVVFPTADGNVENGGAFSLGERQGPRLATGADQGAPQTPTWVRWNDYGIGLLAKPGRGALRQAESAFRSVTELGRPEGALNVARVLLREGRLDEAAGSLREAAATGAHPWSVAWFSGLVDLQNGQFDAAIATLRGVADTRFAEARERGFDFSLDYRLQNTLGRALFERAKLARPGSDQQQWLRRAEVRHQRALAIDSENVAAHHGLAQVYARLGDADAAKMHRALHARYRSDDNARDSAVSAARRRDPAANHAAEAVTVYELTSSQPTHAANPPPAVPVGHGLALAREACPADCGQPLWREGVSPARHAALPPPQRSIPK